MSGTLSSSTSETISFSGTADFLTVMTTGTYDIVAYGAQGGNGDFGGTAKAGGKGAEMGGDVVLTAGEIIEVIAGGQGASTTGSGNGPAGGGGGSFVFQDDNGALTPLVVAGGGGGAAVMTSGGKGVVTTSGAAGSGGSGTNGVAGVDGSGGTGGTPIGPTALETNWSVGGGGGGGGDLTAGGAGIVVLDGTVTTAVSAANGGAAAGGAGGAAGTDGSKAGGFGGGGASGGGTGGNSVGPGGGLVGDGGGGGGGGYSGGGGGGNAGAGGGGGSFLEVGATSTASVAGENAGNGQVTFNFVAACYLRGTRIATPAGDIEIERLAIGDSVMSASGAICTIRWIGHRAYRRPFLSHSQQPVCIAAGALGDGLPRRDLYVSPRHAMWVDGRLIAAEALVNHTTIRVVRLDEVEYLHIELDTHELLLAEGALSESYCDTGNRALFDNAHTAPARPPMVQMGPRIEYLPPAQLTDDPALRVTLADGAEYQPAAIAPGRWCFELSGRPETLLVRSRSAVPAQIGVGDDERRLGVALYRVILRRDDHWCELRAGHPRFLGGFHAASDGAAWTDGEATLALSPDLLPGVGLWQLELHGSPLPAYPIAA